MGERANAENSPGPSIMKETAVIGGDDVMNFRSEVDLEVILDFWRRVFPGNHLH